MFRLELAICKRDSLSSIFCPNISQISCIHSEYAMWKELHTLDNTKKWIIVKSFQYCKLFPLELTLKYPQIHEDTFFIHFPIGILKWSLDHFEKCFLLKSLPCNTQLNIYSSSEDYRIWKSNIFVFFLLESFCNEFFEIRKIKFLCLGSSYFLSGIFWLSVFVPSRTCDKMMKLIQAYLSFSIISRFLFR